MKGLLRVERAQESFIDRYEEEGWRGRERVGSREKGC